MEALSENAVSEGRQKSPQYLPNFDLCSEPVLRGKKADAPAHRTFSRYKFQCDQEEWVRQRNSKGKALLMIDDACISDVIPVKAGHETVDCELVVVTASFEPV